MRPQKTNKLDLPPGITVEFFTDLEGNWEYLSSLVERSSNVHLDSSGNLSLSPNSILVHGGDVVDKGPGDIRVTKALVELKRKHPDRVFLLCGNRDVNKMRFMSELAEGKTGDGTDIYWDAKHQTYKEYIEQNELEDGTVSTLKWMLSCTMGCQTTFETRRLELGILRGQSAGQISDEAVLTSFKESVDPAGDDPWMLEYLRWGQLMLLVGDCAFVHGAIDEKCLGKVPGLDDITTGMEAWCAALNQWMDDMIADFEIRPTWNEEGKRGGEALLDFCVPNGNDGATVVYNTFVKNGNCALPDKATVEYLSNAGINRVFVGHQPHGECPSVIAFEGLKIFLCDTSYSDIKADKALNPANNRGVASTNVFITNVDTTVKGILSNGESHGYSLQIDRKSMLQFSFVGQELVDGSWVKTIIGESALVAKGEGYRVLTRSVPVDEIISKIKRGVTKTVE